MSDRNAAKQGDGRGGVVGVGRFLSELRAELAVAQARAADDPMKLGWAGGAVPGRGVHGGEDGGAQATAKAKFWVLASAEASVSGSVSSQRVRTQHLKLLLTHA